MNRKQRASNCSALARQYFWRALASPKARKMTSYSRSNNFAFIDAVSNFSFSLDFCRPKLNSMTMAGVMDAATETQPTDSARFIAKMNEICMFVFI